MISPALRQAVRERAGRCCEYCRFHEEHLPLWPLHLEHVVAGQHGGADDLENLAWSCQRYNRRKGTNLSGIDPDYVGPARGAWAKRACKTTSLGRPAT